MAEKSNGLGIPPAGNPASGIPPAGAGVAPLCSVDVSTDFSSAKQKIRVYYQWKCISWIIWANFSKSLHKQEKYNFKTKNNTTDLFYTFTNAITGVGRFHLNSGQTTEWIANLTELLFEFQSTRSITTEEYRYIFSQLKQNGSRR